MLYPEWISCSLPAIWSHTAVNMLQRKFVLLSHLAIWGYLTLLSANELFSHWLVLQWISFIARLSLSKLWEQRISSNNGLSDWFQKKWRDVRDFSVKEDPSLCQPERGMQWTKIWGYHKSKQKHELKVCVALHICSLWIDQYGPFQMFFDKFLGYPDLYCRQNHFLRWERVSSCETEVVKK